jgi:hypothetical protein
MAVENKYVNTSIAAGTFADATYNGRTRTIIQTFEIAAADDNGSVYRLARINSNEVLLKATIMCDAITDGTDYDLGIYKPSTVAGAGAVVDKDLFMDGQTLGSASKVLDGMQTVAIENRVLNVVDLTNLVNSTTLANSNQEFDIALTANTVGTAAGTVTVILEIKGS